MAVGRNASSGCTGVTRQRGVLAFETVTDLADIETPLDLGHLLTDIETPLAFEIPLELAGKLVILSLPDCRLTVLHN